MCIRIYILNFKKQQTNKQKQESKKQKKLKKKTEFLRKIDKKKKKCGRRVEDFSRHPHFRKQEYFFWPYYIAMKLIWP